MISKNDNIIRWGGVNVACPKCNQTTAVYPWNTKGQSSATCCVFCGARIQMHDGQPVEAEFSGIPMLPSQHEHECRAISDAAAALGIRYPFPEPKTRMIWRDSTTHPVEYGPIKRLRKFIRWLCVMDVVSTWRYRNSAKSG